MQHYLMKTNVTIWMFLYSSSRHIKPRAKKAAVLRVLLKDSERVLPPAARMGKVARFEIVFSSEEATYVSGRNITGHVVLDLVEAIKVTSKWWFLAIHNLQSAILHALSNILLVTH